MVPPKAINQLKARNTSAHRRLNDLIIGTEIAVGGLDVFAGLEDVDDVGKRKTHGSPGQGVGFCVGEALHGFEDALLVAEP